MSNTLAHRGPDGRKFVADGQIGLGHGLMRVNTEDLFEAQPLHDREAGLTLVADCRIDNREELVEAFGLSAADIRDMPDSAFILAAYRKWGEDCAEHLLGDFAFAVWDSRAKKLVLARDHMGQRYVHYHHGKDFFAFATEIKALWAVPGVPRQLSEAKFGQWLMRARTASNGETFFETIYGVPGATVMRIGRDGTTDQRRYWEPHADPVHLGRDEAYYIAAYRRVLGEAVACRIGRVVRTPGIIFSGGYDSAGIAALSGPVLAGSGRRLIAAASVMPAGYRGTIRHARPWVEMCARDMPHLDVRYVTRENKSILSGLERGFADTGQPNDAYYFVRHELLSALADGGAKVVMDGHGGDYTLNPRGQPILAHLLVTHQFGRFAAEVRDYRRRTGRSLWRTLKSDVAAYLAPRWLGALWLRMRDGVQRPWGDQPIAPAFAERLIAEGAVDPKQLRVGVTANSAMRDQCLRVLRQVMNRTGTGSAGEAALLGLELVRPFHDRRVVELAQAIPEHLYVKGGRNRYLACAALKDLYPPEFQTRWRKNDDEIPDFQRMAKAAEPQILPTLHAWRRRRTSCAISISGRFAVCSRLGERMTTIQAGSRKRSLPCRAILLPVFWSGRGGAISEHAILWFREEAPPAYHEGGPICPEGPVKSVK